METCLSGKWEGRKIFLENKIHTIEGLFKSFDSEENMITLTNVVQYPLGKECNGLFHCCRTEIEDIYTLKYLKNRTHEDFLDKQVPESTHVEQKWNTSFDTDYLTAEDFDTLIMLAKNADFIDCMDSSFDEAVTVIRNQLIIGITAKLSFGLNYGVTFLSISTEMCVYQFDILKLGAGAFKNGLQSIFENKIWKIVHNSRVLSHCLYHKYSVKLNNIFDTQIGELIVGKNISGRFPEKPCNLGVCVKMFLGIPPALVEYNDDTVIWINRPLTKDLKFAAAREVIFLIPLEKSIKARMLSPLKQGTDIFLNIVREAGDDEARQHIGRNHLVPHEFLELEYATLPVNI